MSTKVTVPTPPAQLVVRQRLDTALDAAVADPAIKVVLISAPAGSGKSTLVAAWLDRSDACHGWLQADSADADPARFWTYVVAALATVVPGIDVAVASSLPESGFDAGRLLDRLANELAAFGDPVALVIDDYHLVSNAAIDEGLERLVELSPPGLTLVLCSRIDPSMHLSRLRVRGHLREFRASELRFDNHEASQLLQRSGPAPESHQVDALCERTEGWAAGLVLAAMSLAASADRDAFVADFQGDDRLVVDYLTEEFLAGVSNDERDRLLRTSCLDRFCGPLVDAVCETSDGASWLRDAAAANQLLISLDRTGTWFRYHHLLSDLLRLEAQATIGAELGALHGRAGHWHQSNGNPFDAVEHYLHGGQHGLAADLMYDEATELMNRGQLETLRTQIARLGSVADNHAGVTIVRGWISLFTGQFNQAQRCVADARLLDPNDDEAGLIVALAIMTHLAIGDVAAALAEVAGAGDPFESTQAMTLGGALVWGGRFDEARTYLSQAEDMASGEGHAFVETVAPIFAAIAAIDNNELDQARHHAERALDRATIHGHEDLAHVALAHSIIARTTNDAESAERAARRGVELAKKSSERVMLAYALASGGDVLCHNHNPHGEDFLRQARSIIDTCVDPGIAGRYLARVESRHQLNGSASPVTDLVQDLTDRELAVLRYLPSQLSQRDISSELYVSLNTVKTHCKAIYRKLGVNDRKSAIQAARDQGLL